MCRAMGGENLQSAVVRVHVSVQARKPRRLQEGAEPVLQDTLAQGGLVLHWK